LKRWAIFARPWWDFSQAQIAKALATGDIPSVF
jgi:hypothetical protein